MSAPIFPPMPSHLGPPSILDTPKGKLVVATKGEHTSDWWQKHDELVHFAHVLVDTFVHDWEPKDVLRFFEKPWNWMNEHKSWCDAGRPETMPGWSGETGSADSKGGG